MVHDERVNVWRFLAVAAKKPTLIPDRLHRFFNYLS